MAYFRCTGEGGSPAPVVSEPYIYNTNEVYFNTGYTHNENTKIRMKATFNTFWSYAQAFGARSGGFGNNAMGFFATFNSSRCCYYRTGQEIAGQYYDASTPDTTTMFYSQPIIIECEGKDCSWYQANNPSRVSSLTASNAQVNAGIAPMALFGGNNATNANGWSPTDPCYMLLYWFEIYENDTLLHRFVPAYNNGQYCLYDEVDQTYIYAVSNPSRVRGSDDIPTT